MWLYLSQFPFGPIVFFLMTVAAAGIHPLYIVIRDGRPDAWLSPINSLQQQLR